MIDYLSNRVDFNDRLGIILKGRLLVEGTVENLKEKAGQSPELEDAFLRLTGGETEQALEDFWDDQGPL